MSVRPLARRSAVGAAALVVIAATIVLGARPAAAATTPIDMVVDGPGVFFPLALETPQVVRFPTTPGTTYLLYWSVPPGNDGFNGSIARPEGVLTYFYWDDGDAPDTHEFQATAPSTVLTVLASPYGRAGSMTLWMRSIPPDVDRTIPIDGTPVRVTITKPAQQAHLRFVAPPGRRYVLRWTPHGFSNEQGFVSARNHGAASYFGPNDVSHWREWMADDDGSTEIVVDPDGTDVGTFDLSVRLAPPDVVTFQPTGSWRSTINLDVAQDAYITWPTTPGKRYGLTWVPHGFSTWGYVFNQVLFGELFGRNDEVHYRELFAYGATTEVQFIPTGLSHGSLDVRVTELP